MNQNERISRKSSKLLVKIFCWDFKNFFFSLMLLLLLEAKETLHLFFIIFLRMIRMTAEESASLVSFRLPSLLSLTTTLVVVSLILGISSCDIFDSDKNVCERTFDEKAEKNIELRHQLLCLLLILLLKKLILFIIFLRHDFSAWFCSAQNTHILTVGSP